MRNLILGFGVALAAGCGGIDGSGTCGSLNAGCCTDPARPTDPGSCNGGLYCDYRGVWGVPQRCVAVVGGYMQSCYSDGSCNPGYTCMTDYALTARCVLPIDSARCGEPGQPCCKSWQPDHTVAKFCQPNGECEFYCAAGLRCDGSHRTGPGNVCVAD